MREDFAVLILTHGRPDNMPTVQLLRDGGYTGKTYFVLDNEDNTEERYKNNYGEENVVIFDKQAVMEKTDTMDITGEKKVILFARRAAFDIAKELGLKYFLTLEDDYTGVEYRYKKGEKLGVIAAKNLDELFEAMVQFLVESNALTVCMAQGGDFIGGINSKNFSKGILRKAMNSFFCRTDRFIDFRGTINEDVNTYTTLGSRGELMLTVTNASIRQLPTQSLNGGMTETYKDNGTFLKSFYSVISMPSAVKVSMMGDKHFRIHHNVNWKNCVPEILNEKYKK